MQAVHETYINIVHQMNLMFQRRCIYHMSVSGSKLGGEVIWVKYFPFKCIWKPNVILYTRFSDARRLKNIFPVFVMSTF